MTTRRIPSDKVVPSEPRTTPLGKYGQWCTVVQSPGGVALMPYEALRLPCPQCKQTKGWMVTSDAYAYCESCGFGTPTEFPFTNWLMEQIGVGEP